MDRYPVGDIELACIDRGVGLPVLLVHGFPLDHSMWQAQIDALAGEFRVIAPDLRGCGESQLGAVDMQHGVSMERYADDLAQLLDVLGVTEPVVFCGFSMGGYVLWQFVVRYGVRVRGLMLCDTRAGADDEQTRETRLKMAEHVTEWGAEKVAEAMKPKLFAKKTLEERAEVVERVTSVIRAADPAAITAAQRGMAARPDMTGLLSQLICPTLVLVGHEDAISTQSEMEFMANQIPGACFAEIPDAGHMAPVEQPELVTAAMQNYLRQL